MRQRTGWKTATRLLLAAAVWFGAPKALAELTAHDHSVELTATIAEIPPEITLQWLPDANAAGYEVSRKILGDPAWTKLASLDGGATGWKDSTVTTGVAYEYQVIKPTGGGYTGYGYICSAIRRDAVENRGRMILLVEKDLAGALPDELMRLQQDLIGDGWTVVRRDVSKTTPVTEVKNLLRTIYEADRDGTKGLFLFGHIPAPYSGDISPDMHPDDLGAWPADVYYADLEGEWTDNTVVRTNSTNPNIPGDGKFDQSVPPAPVRLQMGRVDLSNLTCFANKTPARYELDLARQYLQKDHNFRHGQFDVQRRAMIFDRMYRGMELEPQTCAAWRSFPGFFGRDQVRVIGQDEYFPILSTDSYLWSYVVSGGSVYGSDYIGTSDTWALNEPKVVFTSFLGSWFGQWDKESDFLRAPLGTSGYTLTCIFSGQPQWILHPMGMGEPIGLAALLTQNNTTNGLYPPQINAGSAEVHIDLMGDPGLRMHPFKPPGAVTASFGDDGVALAWRASADSGVLGYYIYKANSAEGPFARASGANPIASTSFNDSTGTTNDHYMVRALKLEQTPAGSYFNLSQGVFYPDSLAPSGVPDVPRSLEVGSIAQGGVNITWISESMNVRAFEVQRRTLPDGMFATVAEVAATASSFNDINLSAGQYAYRVKALGFAGDSDFSGEASVNLQPSWVSAVSADKTTAGNWIGNYGQDGYIVVSDATNLPAYVSLTTKNAVPYVSSWDSTPDTETLLRPDGKTRLASYWFNPYHAPMIFTFRFSDNLVHRISFYMVDYKDGRRSGFLDLIDPFTGRVFSSSYFTNFQAGEYFTFDVRNYVDVQIRPEYEFMFQVFVSGIFFSTPPQTTNSPETSVTFISTDLTTKGDWRSQYGSAGQVFGAGAANLPAGIQVDAAANQTWTWSTSTTDPRALNQYSADGSRLAAGWYGGECNFDLTVDSTQPRQLALYFVDWDYSGRVQDLLITDPSGAILLQKRLDHFEGGQYVVLNAKGKFRVSLRRISGPNAILNGMFFGSGVTISSAPPQLDSSLDTAGSVFAIRINGQPGQVFEIQSSSDFGAWTAIGQKTLSGNSADFTIPFSANEGARFYRAVLSQ